MLEVNCDMGEFDTLELDLRLFPYVDILNIATGGHAGSREHALELAQRAFDHGKLFTAHFGYTDRENFGRIEHKWNSKFILDQLKIQWMNLPSLTELGGWKWVKFHGALYNRLMSDQKLAEDLIVWLVQEGFEGIIAPKNSEQAKTAKKYQLEVKNELFIERRYVLSDLGIPYLMPREMEGAVIEELEEAIMQYINISTNREIEIKNLSGDFISYVLEGDTVCVHSDSKIAFKLVKVIDRLK
jgi:5-oxoprolinase (ATP-hydrolysing) subunit A